MLKNTRIQEYFPKKDITKIPKNRNNHLNKIALIHHKHSEQKFSDITNRQIHAKQIYFKGKMFFFALSQRTPRDELLK